jgi:hypothetical protein
MLRLNSTLSCSTTPIWRRSELASASARSNAVHQHPPALGHVQPLHQLGQRALARAGVPDDADDLAQADVQRHPREHFRAVGAVAEHHVIERDAPAQPRQRRARARGLDAGVEDVVQALH